MNRPTARTGRQVVGYKWEGDVRLTLRFGKELGGVVVPFRASARRRIGTPRY